MIAIVFRIFKPVIVQVGLHLRRCRPRDNGASGSFAAEHPAEHGDQRPPDGVSTGAPAAARHGDGLKRRKTTNQHNYVVNDYPSKDRVLVHTARCGFAERREGKGWSRKFDNLEAAINCARRHCRRDARGCYFCLRALDDLTRPMHELIALNPYD